MASEKYREHAKELAKDAISFPAPIAVARSSRWRLSEVNALIDSWNRQANV